MGGPHRSFDIALTALDDVGVPYFMRDGASVGAAWMLNLAARVKRAHDRVSDQYSEAGHRTSTPLMLGRGRGSRATTAACSAELVADAEPPLPV